MSEIRRFSPSTVVWAVALFAHLLTACGDARPVKSGGPPPYRGWARQLELFPSTADFLIDAAVDSSGDVYLLAHHLKAGFSRNVSGEGWSTSLTKVKSDGAVLWQKTWPFGMYEYPNNSIVGVVDVAPDGGVVFSGQFTADADLGNGVIIDRRPFVVCYASDGSWVWQIVRDSLEKTRQVDQSAGHIGLISMTSDPGAEFDSLALLSNGGGTVWSEQWGGAEGGVSYGIGHPHFAGEVLDEEGAMFVVGEASSPANFGNVSLWSSDMPHTPFIFKVTSEGFVDWIVLPQRDVPGGRGGLLDVVRASDGLFWTVGAISGEGSVRFGEQTLHVPPSDNGYNGYVFVMTVTPEGAVRSTALAEDLDWSSLRGLVAVEGGVYLSIRSDGGPAWCSRRQLLRLDEDGSTHTVLVPMKSSCANEVDARVDWKVVPYPGNRLLVVGSFNGTIEIGGQTLSTGPAQNQNDDLFFAVLDPSTPQ